MEVQLASSSEKQVWITKFLTEYVRESGLMPYMGKSDTSIFQFRTELLQEAGKTINMPVVASLKGSGVTGSQVLDGNEEDLQNFNDQITVDWLRNGVRVPKSTQYLTEINLMDAAKSALRTWDAEKLRDGLLRIPKWKRKYLFPAVCRSGVRRFRIRWRTPSKAFLNCSLK